MIVVWLLLPCFGCFGVFAGLYLCYCFDWCFDLFDFISWLGGVLVGGFFCGF